MGYLWLFHHIIFVFHSAQLLSHICQFPNSPGGNRRRVEQPNSKDNPTILLDRMPYPVLLCELLSKFYGNLSIPLNCYPGTEKPRRRTRRPGRCTGTRTRGRRRGGCTRTPTCDDSDGADKIHFFRSDSSLVINFPKGWAVPSAEIINRCDLQQQGLRGRCEVR